MADSREGQGIPRVAFSLRCCLFALPPLHVASPSRYYFFALLLLRVATPVRYFSFTLLPLSLASPSPCFLFHLLPLHPASSFACFGPALLLPRVDSSSRRFFSFHTCDRCVNKLTTRTYRHRRNCFPITRPSPPSPQFFVPLRETRVSAESNGGLIAPYSGEPRRAPVINHHGIYLRTFHMLVIFLAHSKFLLLSFEGGVLLTPERETLYHL